MSEVTQILDAITQGDQAAAAVLGESVRSVYRDWRHARTWLALELGEDPAAETADGG